MIELNKILLVGNLVRDPETRYTQNNNAVANFAIAVNRRRGRDMDDEVAFIDCQAWTQTAEFIQKWFKKGRPIFVEGRLKMDRWQDRDSGQNRSKLLVLVEKAGFVSSGKPADGEQSGGGGSYRKDYSEDAGPGPGDDYSGGYDDAPTDDDLPF